MYCSANACNHGGIGTTLKLNIVYLDIDVLITVSVEELKQLSNKWNIVCLGIAVLMTVTVGELRLLL